MRLYSCGEACGYGSRARGEAGPESDVDLLITAPDAWLASRDRCALLADLWGTVAQPDPLVNLVLHSSSEAARRTRQPGSLAQEAFRGGVLLDAKRAQPRDEHLPPQFTALAADGEGAHARAIHPGIRDHMIAPASTPGSPGTFISCWRWRGRPTERRLGHRHARLRVRWGSQPVAAG